jgi:hypothetical protein
MKYLIPILILSAGLLPKAGLCQLNNGGLYANFGVDADTRTNWMKYGILTGAVSSDDWFAPTGLGYNVIDTSNGPTYLALLQAGNNISFNKRMSALLYAKMGGKLWLDAVYGRDFQAAAQLKDSTTFTIAAKNGDNPINWQGGVSSFPNKNDLVDVYAHMRRDGTTVYDSLWLFTGVSTFGTRGSSYFDVELYKNSFTYSAATGTFTTAGTSGGHTQWLFDASGNIIQTGDLIIAVDFSPGLVPVVDIRIWVSQTTLSTVTPARFSFTGAFNGASASPTYGYASIVSKTGSTAFGAGISNYSLNATLDTTYSTPWGTSGPAGGPNWTPQYLSQQFIEVGLNLTRIGVDPALYSALSPCQPLFSDIFFKSRSSNSFTSNMQDFVTPLTFTRTPVMDYSLQGDTIRCNHQAATITLTNNSTVGYYTWQAAAGISGSNSDSSQLNISKPGTYIVSASPAAGCPPTRVDTIVVPIDTFPPVASAGVGLTGAFQLQLYGGNAVASNYPTPFGGSQGLTYAWTGPSGFTSNQQNRLTDTVWGTYLITSTEKRNGCTDTASVKVTWAVFTALSAHDLMLNGVARDGGISLHWADAGAASVSAYVVERMDASSRFQAIGTVDGGGCQCFVDAQPLAGVNEYRVEAVSVSGSAYYSAVISVAQSGSGNSVYFAGTNLIADMNKDQQAVLVVYDVTGQTLARQNIWLSKGNNTIALPVGSGAPAVRVVGLQAEGKVVFAGKGLW